MTKSFKASAAATLSWRWTRASEIKKMTQMVSRAKIHSSLTI